ncbi:MAG: AsmA-like C-terminal domain-containing protein [Ancalomicrobiaceae bacterium]|nr:AsmA-like C-terminal domain-containing protein [Ancalomicrobiaceae bacterium]
MAPVHEVLLRPRRRRHWRFVRLCAGTLATLVFIAVLALAALIWRLSTGPLEVDQIARMAAQVLSDTIGAGRHASVGAAELGWSWANYGPVVRLQRIEVADEAGGLTISIPTATIELRSLPMLWGAVKPVALELSGPRISADVARLEAAGAKSDRQSPKSGPDAKPDTLAPGTQTAAADATTATHRPAAFRLIETVARSLRDSVDHARSEGLSSIDVRGGSIEVARPGDAGQTVRVTIPDIEIAGHIDAAGAVDLNFSARGEIGRWGMRYRQMRADDGKGTRLVFEASDVTVKDLIGQLPPDIVLNIPAYPVMEARLDDAGALTAFRLDLQLGAGQFHFGKYPEDEMQIDDGDILVSWNPAEDVFVVEHAGASTGPTTVYAKGRIVPPAEGAEPTGAVWRFDLGLDKAVLAPRDAGGEPLPVDALTVAGGLDLAKKQLVFDRIDARFGGTGLTGGGMIDLARDKPQIMLDFQLLPADWTMIRRAWPSFIAAGARNWFVKQVVGGRLTDASIKLDLPMFTDPLQLPTTSVTLSGRFQGGAVHTFGDLPDAINLDGSFFSKDRRLEAVADNGQAATKAPKKPDLTGVKFSIDNIFQRNPKGHVEFHIVGDNSAVGEIVNSEPLAVLDDSGIKPDGLAGTADVRGKVDLILEDPVKPEDIEFHVEAILDRFGSPNPIMGRKFQEANVMVVADPNVTAVTGKAKIDGIATDVNIREPRVKGNLAEKRNFKMTLDDAARQRMGLDLSKVLTGPIQIAIVQSPGNEKSRHFDIDLTPARLTLAPFGWTKGAGVPAKASLDYIDDDKSARLENFTIESEGVQIKGRIDLDRDHKPASADFVRFALRKGDDAKLKLQRLPDQSLAVNFDAASFDARGLIQMMKHSGETPGETDKAKATDYVVKAHVGRLIGFNDTVFGDAGIDLVMHSGTVTKLALTATTPGGEPMTIEIKPQDAKRSLKLSSDDAGAVLAFLDLYDRMHGGTFTLSAMLGAPGEAEGALRIHGFKLQGEGKSQVAASVAPDGTRTVSIRKAALADDAMFDQFATRYMLRKGVITVTDGVARGQATGATTSGQIDLNNQKMQLKGTFIPIYIVNNLIGRIPILGEIAGAGRNEGLVGITFKIAGSVDDPVLQINPISAIAPGIFRKIFEFQVDDSRRQDAAEQQ